MGKNFEDLKVWEKAIDFAEADMSHLTAQIEEISRMMSGLRRSIVSRDSRLEARDISPQLAINN